MPRRPVLHDRARATVLLPELADRALARPALIASDGAALSHRALRERVSALAGVLPDASLGGRLVHVPLRADVASITAYLAVLEAGHTALVTQPQATAILERYEPDLVVTGDADAPFTAWPERPRHLLHPQLALLMSTSGSTGSPKLVRLSRQGVSANARAIAEALRLQPGDRGLTSLPLHYCFGLSVLHSHLAAGAAVVLHEGSVAEPDAWRAVDAHGVTTLAVVPHGIDLLEVTEELERPHPSLRLIAQAGGRLAPERVRRVAALGERRGFGVAVMYGQTEATARIAVLDPALAAAAPDAVGAPVPGTRIRIDVSVAEADASAGIGEVVVEGPGVMMGYAEHADDLALGAELDELRTGDLGRIGADGLLRIVGRRAAFVKVLGLRVDLGAVERALEQSGVRGVVVGDDTGLGIVVEPEADADAGGVRRLAADAAGVGLASIAVALAPVPRLPSGKPDRRAALLLARGADARTADAGGSRGAIEAERAVLDAVAHVLGTDPDALRADRSFAQLGGDSLSLVQASVRLEALAGGPLRRGWHHRPLAEVVALAETAARSQRGGAPRRWRSIEMPVLLRALAAVAICGSHAQLFDLQGGAHILLAAAGAGAAGFALAAPDPRARRRAAARTILAIAMPAALVALFGWLVLGRYGWANVLLVHGFLPMRDPQPSFDELWFVEVLVWSLVLLVAVLSPPPIARAWRRSPWAVAAAITAAAILVSRVLPVLGVDGTQGTLVGSLWFVAIGVAAAHADSWARRLATLGLLLAGGVGLFADEPVRYTIVLAGIAALVLVPSVRVPRALVPTIAIVAAASLYIYLVQFMVLAALEPDLFETVVALAVGVLVHLAADHPMRRLQDAVVPVHRDAAPRAA